MLRLATIMPMSNQHSHKRRSDQAVTRTPKGEAALGLIGSHFDEPGTSPGFLLWQVATLWQRRVRAVLEEVALTHTQFVLLASAAWLEAQSELQDSAQDRVHGDASTELKGKECVVVTQALIAEHARTDAVMTSEVLRTLERKRLLRRLPHPTDARAWRIVLTPSGRATVRRAIALVEAVDEKFFGEPGPELRSLARLLGPTPAEIIELNRDQFETLK